MELIPATRMGCFKVSIGDKLGHDEVLVPLSIGG